MTDTPTPDKPEPYVPQEVPEEAWSEHKRGEAPDGREHR